MIVIYFIDKKMDNPFFTTLKIKLTLEERPFSNIYA